MSRFNDVLSAYWTILNADTTFAGLMARGTKYTFSAGNLMRPLKYEPAWCPILALAPAPDGHKWRPARRRRGDGLAETFVIHAEGVTKGDDRALILNLADAFRLALEADMTSSAGSLPGLNVDEIEFEGLSLDPRPNVNDVIETWAFRVSCINRFRVS